MLRLKTLEERTLEEAPALPPGRRRADARRGFWAIPTRPATLGAGLPCVSIACVVGASPTRGARTTRISRPSTGPRPGGISTSWHDFIFGALDPAGTVTVDSFRARCGFRHLSLRILGFHVWAAVLPQIVEGVAHRAGALPRRAASRRAPVAGITAAARARAQPGDGGPEPWQRVGLAADPADRARRRRDGSRPC